MNDFSVKDKTVLVTGASSGIGRQIAVTVARAGGRIVITGRDEQRLIETHDLLCGEDRHQRITADLTVETDIDNLVETIDGLDGLVHCAGIIRPLPVKFISQKEIDVMRFVNIDAPMILTAKLFRQRKIRNGASIVFISSISSRFPYKGGALYCSAKAGIDAFSKVIAVEYAGRKIRSNCINAALVKTPLLAEARKNRTRAMMAAHEEQYPLGLGEPIDIANAVLFLLSNASRWITGTSIVMDGGLTAGI